MNPLPCPKCGARAEIIGPRESDDGFAYVVCSENCGVEPAWAPTTMEAIELWNTRGSPQS